MGGKKKETQSNVGQNVDDPVDQKNAGNAAFQAGKLEEALAFYSRAIELDSTQAAFYSNRANCLIKLNCAPKAEEDADEAIKLDPKFAKAYMRKALAILDQPQKADCHARAKKACEDGLACDIDDVQKLVFNNILETIRKELEQHEHRKQFTTEKGHVSIKNVEAFEKWLIDNGTTGYF